MRGHFRKRLRNMRRRVQRERANTAHHYHRAEAAVAELNRHTMLVTIGHLARLDGPSTPEHLERRAIVGREVTGMVDVEFAAVPGIGMSLGGRAEARNIPFLHDDERADWDANTGIPIIRPGAGQRHQDAGKLLDDLLDAMDEPSGSATFAIAMQRARHARGR